MAPRPVSAAIVLVAIALAACSGAAPSAVPATPTATATPGPVTPTPETPAPVTPAPTPEATQGGTGNVDNPAGGPVLGIEPGGGDAIRATIEDPAAKAWRLVVAGTGELAANRWEISVETGDTAPVITATEVVDGRVVDTMDLTGYLDGTAAAGGCHSVLPVCLDSSGFRLPADGDGRLAVVLHLPEAGTPLVITGATAGWDGEPFVLGPWTVTDPFTWGVD